MGSLPLNILTQSNLSTEQQEAFKATIARGTLSCAEELGIRLIFEEEKSPAKSAMAPVAPPVVRVLTLESPNGKIVAGSGFYVTANLIATNHHVVRGSSAAVIAIEGKQPFRAEVLYRDPNLDFAILGSPVDGVPLNIRNAPIHDGEAIFAWGYPQGRERIAFSSGTIKVINEAVIVHDALIAAGSSGGPLTDTDGNVLGVVTFLTKADGDKANESDRGIAVKMNVIMRSIAARLAR